VGRKRGKKKDGERGINLRPASPLPPLEEKSMEKKKKKKGGEFPCVGNIDGVSLKFANPRRREKGEKRKRRGREKPKN